jgi:hypothetical protein
MQHSPNNGGIPIVVISSTVLDLHEHRKEAMDACLRQDMFPKMMEHLPAESSDAIEVSRSMIDDADIYIGIFAHSYGYVPKGYDVSITEMEYNRAVERKIPRLIFVMGKDHLITADDVEVENVAKLKAFKERVQAENIINFYNSPADLRANVINSLSQLRVLERSAFHYVSKIPEPPEAYIAHPYTLLQTHRLVGRQAELNLLTDWVTKSEEQVYQAHILNVVAIGGMGKSALTWKWFNEIAPHEMKPLAGRMWWSFYESDARFENFVVRALAYVTGKGQDDLKRIPAQEREDELVHVLNTKPFLLVLDGLERLLIAYARLDAAHMADGAADEETGNSVSSVIGTLSDATQSSAGTRELRKTADPRAGNFLRKLAGVKASRILISTRLYPADLQTATGEPMPGCTAHSLIGMKDSDAIDLWRAFGAGGFRDALLSMFNTFDKHPLLIQALAREIANYRRAPKDFDRWQRDHKDFNPFGLDLVQVKSHVLDFALRGLSQEVRTVLQTIAAFRMPAAYETLTALLVGGDKVLPDEAELDCALRELEDRGLLGWDRRANRYDLHPIVRGIAWNRLPASDKQSIYSALQAYFESIPTMDEDKIESLEDLTTAIELYNTLIGQERYEDAWNLFDARISKPLWFRLSASREQASLLEPLLLDKYKILTERKALLRLPSPELQAGILDALASAYHLIGKPGMAEGLYRDAAYIEAQTDAIDPNFLNKRKEEHYSIRQQRITPKHLRTKLSAFGHLSAVRRLSGKLRDSIGAALDGLNIAREHGDLLGEATNLRYLGLALAVCNDVNNSQLALERALRIYKELRDPQAEGTTLAFLAQRALWIGDFQAASQLTEQSWRLAEVKKYKRDFVRVARLQGATALGLNDLSRADERFSYALTNAREVIFIEEELPAQIGLAETQRRQKHSKSAREDLYYTWQAAENGPFLLSLVDAWNTLARLERDEGNMNESIEAATKACRLAWCDGLSFSYYHGLETARSHLSALAAPEPCHAAAYSDSALRQIVEVEINPPDQFAK